MISALIVVRNEEPIIRKCLEAVKWVDEIIVVDQSSTDRTRDICHEYTDKIYITENKLFADPDRTFGESKASGDWILCIDADEIVTPELAEEIRSVVRTDKYVAYNLANRNFFLGKWIIHCDWYPAYKAQLFRKGMVRLNDKVHRDFVPLGKTGCLKNDLLHYPYATLDQYFEKFNRYTTLLAREDFDDGVRIGRWNWPWYLVLKPCAYFVNKYVRKQGFMDGMRGFLISYFTFLTVLMQAIKLLDIQRRERV
jgi:glycosyltransferase involved in cell wall biosynthesis